MEDPSPQDDKGLGLFYGQASPLAMDYFVSFILCYKSNDEDGGFSLF